MTLSFSQKWGKDMGDLRGQPNHFIVKIWDGIVNENPVNHPVTYERFLELKRYIQKHSDQFGRKWDEMPKTEYLSVCPKIHTIRTDTSNRWKTGNDIHFVINNRTKDRFQFAPVVKCRRVQKIHIKIYKSVEYDMYGEYSGVETNREVWVDDFLLSKDATKELAINDGFPDTKSFFDFFENGFNGKIIHWTDKRY